jgi:hypothetical protein
MQTTIIEVYGIVNLVTSYVRKGSHFYSRCLLNRILVCFTLLFTVLWQRRAREKEESFKRKRW